MVEFSGLFVQLQKSSMKVQKYVNPLEFLGFLYTLVIKCVLIFILSHNKLTDTTQASYVFIEHNIHRARWKVCDLDHQNTFYDLINCTVCDALPNEYVNMKLPLMVAGRTSYITV